MMNGYGGWGVGAWLMMALITLAVLALIVAGVVALNRRSHSATPPPPAPGSGGSDALRTLNDRFARGEIDETEYTKRRDLSHLAERPSASPDTAQPRSAPL